MQLVAIFLFVCINFVRFLFCVVIVLFCCSNHISYIFYQLYRLLEIYAPSILNNKKNMSIPDDQRLGKLRVSSGSAFGSSQSKSYSDQNNPFCLSRYFLKFKKNSSAMEPPKWVSWKCPIEAKITRPYTIPQLKL